MAGRDPAALAGLYGLWSMARPPLRNRTDRVIAFGCSTGVALLAGAGVGYMAYLIQGMLPEGRDPVDALVSGTWVGVLFGLAAIGGYAVFARRGAGPLVLAGVLVGPALLIVLPLVVASTLARAVS